MASRPRVFSSRSRARRRRQRVSGGARTGADGRYSLRVNSEQAYIVTATKEGLAAPYRADVVVRAGKPVEGVDLVLGPATKLRGQVTVGKDNRPVPDAYITVVIDKGEIPKELRRKDDNIYHDMSMYFWAQTDKDGRYEFQLGPGDYEIRGPAHTEPVKVTIPAEKPPAEIVQNFAMPRPEVGTLWVMVADAQGKPVPGAVVSGRYSSSQARRWFFDQTTDDKGRFRIERSLDPLVLHASAAGGRLGGVKRVDAEANGTKVVVGPVATAIGRLKGTDGKALGAEELTYGIRVFDGEPGNSPFSDNFGGTVKTDRRGSSCSRTSCQVSLTI